MPRHATTATILSGLVTVLTAAAPAAASAGAPGAATATGWAVLCLFGALVGIVLARFGAPSV